MDWGAPRVLPTPMTQPMIRRPGGSSPPTEPMIRLPGGRTAHALQHPGGIAAPTAPAVGTAGGAPRLVEWLLAGGVAGLMVGWLDGYWAATRAGLEPLSVAGYRSTIILAILLTVVGCSLLALLTWPLAAPVYRRNVPARLLGFGRRMWRPLALLASAGIVGFLIWAQHIGLQWAALDVRLPLLVGLDLGVFMVIRAGVRAWPEEGVSVALFALAGALVILTAGYSVLPDGRSEALARLGGESAASAKFLNGARFLADADGDGHPVGLCVEDCDCDDDDPGVHPGAREIVDNGVDEDCDGLDQTAADLTEYAALIQPTAPPLSEGPAPQPAPTPAPPEVLDLPLVDASDSAPPNIVFVVVDTLRADHVGAYGYKRPVTPNLDALAESGVLFEQARAAGPQTRFSVPPMLTGKYFTEIERTIGGWPAVRLKETLVAERMQARGYQTAAVHSISYFKKWSGMAQGMETHDVRCAKGRTARTSDCVTDRTLEWFDKVRDAKRPFFLWSYYGDPHAPYQRHLETPSYGSAPKDIYDQEVQFTDIHLGRLIEGMRRRGVDLTNTYFIITSDHGEGLDEREDHGHRYHGATLTDEVMRVPLIIAGPGLDPSRVTTPVSLLDLTPTFMNLVGAPRDDSFRGVSLMPWLMGDDEAPHGPTFFEKQKADALPQKGMVMWPYKVILVLPYHRLKVYDLEKDPRETVDIKDTLAADDRRRLVGTLKYWMNHSLKPVKPIPAASGGGVTR